MFGHLGAMIVHQIGAVSSVSKSLTGPSGHLSRPGRGNKDEACNAPHPDPSRKMGDVFMAAVLPSSRM